MKVGELFASLSADTAQFNKDLDRAEGMARQRGTTIGNIFGNAFSVTVGMAMFQAIQNGFRAVVGEAVNFNSMMEQAHIGFTTMLGSAKHAQAFLDEMAFFAARTPFEYPDLLTAARRMMAMGFEAQNVLPTLTAVGNAAAGLGLGAEGINRITLALGQMRAKARVSGEEMRQLAEAGIPAWSILAEAMGKTEAEVMKMSELRLISADKAIPQLVAGMNKRFPDMMKNMENTWQGVTSTIRDVWRMTLGSLTSNLFGSITRWLQGVRDWSTAFYNTFRQFGLQAALAMHFGPEFAATIDTAVKAIRTFWNHAVASIANIIQLLIKLRPVLLAALGVFLSFRIVTYIFNAASAAVAWHSALQSILAGKTIAAAGGFGLLSGVVQGYRLQLHLANVAGIVAIGTLTKLSMVIKSVLALLGPKAWLLMAVSAAVVGATGLWDKYATSVARANQQAVNDAMKRQMQNVAKQSQAAAKGINETTSATEAATKAAADNVQAFDEVHQLAAEGAQAPGVPELGAMPDLQDMLEMPELEMPELSFEEHETSLRGFWDFIKQGSAKVWDGVKEKWGGFTDWAGGVWGVIKANWYRDWATWDAFTSRITTHFQSIWSTVRTTWEAFLTWASNIWDAVRTRWGLFLDWAGNIWAPIRTTWDAFTSRVTTHFQNIWSTVRTTWEAFLTWASNIWAPSRITWSTFTTWISASISNIFDGVRTRWTGFQTWAGNIWANVKQRWSDFLDWAGRWADDIGQTIRNRWRNAAQWGRNLVQSIIDGIESMLEKLKGAARRLADAVGGFIGFRSPTKEGPGRYADEWAPNLVKMYAKGITDNIGLIRDATAMMSAELMPANQISMSGIVAGKMPTLKASDYHGDIEVSMTAAIRTVLKELGVSAEREAIINIDGQRIARAILPAIVREEHRTGMNGTAVIRSG